MYIIKWWQIKSAINVNIGDLKQPPHIKTLFEKYSILDYGHKWMLMKIGTIWICSEL